jgi:Uncharacterised nucleotidyltransferase
MRDGPRANPEWNLLLIACADRLSAAPEANSPPESHPAIDPEKLAALALHHGVVPQLYRFLSQNSATLISDQLRMAHADNIRRSLWFAEEMLRVARHLRAKCIPALAYKGPLLAEILYGDVAARQFNDLDFLVCPKDVASARTELERLGYWTSAKLSRRQEQEYLRSGYEYSFDHQAGHNLLELHWHIQPRFYAVDIAMEVFFKRARLYPFGNEHVESLACEDLMIVLCAHAAKHAFTRLSMLCDIARLAQLQSLDWKIIRQRTSHYGVCRILSVTFELARQLLNLPVPASIKIDEASATLANEFSRRIEIDQEEEFDPTSAEYFELMLRLRERKTDKAKLLWRLCSTPSMGEWEAVSLPDSLFPLYRIVRAGRLARRLASAIL